MRQLSLALAALVALSVILFVTLTPEGGLAWNNPLAALSLGLIGLGLCKASHGWMAASSSVRGATARTEQ